MAEDVSVRGELDRALRNAKHLRVRHSPAVAAARVLADRLDDSDGRTDHVLAGSFLKYLEALGLVDQPVKRAPVKKPKAEESPAAVVSSLDGMRKGLRAVK